LWLSNPFDGYSSPDATEALQIHQVSTSITTLANGTGGTAAYTDLGDGVVYGGPHSVSASDNGTYIAVPLNATFANIAAQNAGASIALGGALTTLSGAGANEFVFAYTDNDLPDTQLVIITGVLTPIETWRLANFGTASNAGNAADLADFDFDGVSNLFEFAFGTNPALGSSGALPLIYAGTFGGGGTIVRTGQPALMLEPGGNGVDFRALYVRRKDFAAAGLSYSVQFTAELGPVTTWVPSAEIPTVLADDGVHQIVSVPYPRFIGGQKARFFRVSVTLAP
jgi:hypothetical protein